MPDPSRFLRPALALALAALAVSIATSAPASAGTLVLRRGGWIRTRGPWRRVGDRIRFRSMQGQLRTLAADEVDLAASGDVAPEPGDREIRDYPDGRWRPIPSGPRGPAPDTPPATPPRRPAPVCRLETVERDQPPRLTCDPGRKPDERPRPDRGGDGPSQDGADSAAAHRDTP